MRFKLAGRCLYLALPIIGFALSGHAHAIGITTQGNFLDIGAVGVGGVGDGLFVNSSVAIPLSATDIADHPDGTASITADYEFTNDPGEAVLQFDFDMALTGGFYTTGVGSVRFTVDEAVTFDVSGSLMGTAADPADEFRLFFMLSQLGSGGGLIYQENEFFNGTSAALELGDGVFTTGNGGPTSGVLAPGQYQFSYDFLIQDAIAGAGGAIDGDMTGLGSLTLSLTGQTVGIPEPAALLLIGAGLLGMRFARTKQA